MRVPDPDYVQTEDGTFIAYQVVGDGPVDIAWQFDFGGSLDVWWESRWASAWFEGLTSIGRLILHDGRGTGLSSRNVRVGNLETRAADLLAVLDAVDSKSAVMAAWGEGLAPCVLLAASDPARVRALVWQNPLPRTAWAPDYPWGDGPAEVSREREALKQWGRNGYSQNWADMAEAASGGRPSDEMVDWITKKSRNTCTPDVAIELTEIWWQTDIRGVMPVVQVPTLFLVEEGGPVHPDLARQVAELMPHAQLEWTDNDPGWILDRHHRDRVNRPIYDAIHRFLGIEPSRVALDTVLATVLFTDIVESTEHQARLGDHAWKEVVQRHHAAVRDALNSWRGVENDTAGDGFYATFDGPARAIHCAHEIRDGVRDLGIEIRAGIHTGECEVIDGKHTGIAVTTGARISTLAQSSQVLVSQTVKDLVAGSGFIFDPAGEHELKGIPERYRLYAVS